MNASDESAVQRQIGVEYRLLRTHSVRLSKTSADLKRYAGEGAPVFMTGAGVVQSASAIGFETLYAGYRWDGASPQMY